MKTRDNQNTTEQERFFEFMANFFANYMNNPEAVQNTLRNPASASKIIEKSRALADNPAKIESYINLAGLEQILTPDRVKKSLGEIERDYTDILGNLNVGHTADGNNDEGVS